MSEAASPAAISSFFEVCDTDPAGNALTDPTRIGARGGGFGIARGVRARVYVRKASQVRISIRINSKPAPEARTTRSAITQILKTMSLALDVKVELRVAVPIRAGYGTSAAGTIASCLALTDAANIPMTMNELARITHVAEVQNRTGLGTASALLTGGFVLVTEPGAPGIGRVDRLRFPQGHLVICGYLGPISTRAALAQSNVAGRVNPLAERAMDIIRRKPDLRTFLDAAREFSKAAGFQTPGVSRLIQAMISTGCIGATQNMIGEAVHAVIAEDKASRALTKLRKAVPLSKFFVSRVDDRGVRLVEPANPKH